MPALVKSSVGSLAGTSDDECTRRCPLPSKKRKNFSRISEPVGITLYCIEGARKTLKHRGTKRRIKRSDHLIMGPSGHRKQGLTEDAESGIKKNGMKESEEPHQNSSTYSIPLCFKGFVSRLPRSPAASAAAGTGSRRGWSVNRSAAS